MKTIIPPDAAYPHTVTLDSDDETCQPRALVVDGATLPLNAWAADCLTIAVYEITENERRIAHWRGQIQHTAERVLRGEDGT